MCGLLVVVVGIAAILAFAWVVGFVADLFGISK